MITAEQSKRREYMVKLMQEVKGVHYALGWLASEFSRPGPDQDMIQRIVERTIAELEADKTASEEAA